MTKKNTQEKPVESKADEVAAEERPAPKTTAEGLALVARRMAEIGIAKSNRMNAGRGGAFDFRSVDQVFQTLSPMLVEAGLIMTPTVEDLETSEIHPLDSSKGVTYKATIRIRYDFRLASNPADVISATFVGVGLDNYDKAANKAASACFKYCVFQTFCVPLSGCIDSDAEPEPEQPTGPVQRDDDPAGVDDLDEIGRSFLDRIEKADSPAKIQAIGREMASRYGVGRVPETLGQSWKAKRDALRSNS